MTRFDFIILGDVGIRLTQKKSEPQWDLIAFRGIAAEKLADSIVRNYQNTIAYSCRTSDRRLFCRFLSLASRSLVRRLLLLGGEALRLFAADRAFPNVISTVIVSHKFLYSLACCVVARANLKRLIYRSDRDRKQKCQ